MNLSKIIAACGTRVCGGSEYLWDCYGSDARYMEFADINGRECCHIVFDTKTQDVYEIGLYKYDPDVAIGWHNPAFLQAYLNECALKKVEPFVAWDSLLYQQVNSIDTVLECAVMIGNAQYDRLPAQGVPA
jgi:hypothetical protein